MSHTPRPDMRFHVPVRSRRLRWLALVYGAIAVLWLSREDNDVVAVTVLGCGLSLLLLAFAVTGQFGGRHIPVRFVVIGGAVLGLVAGLGTAVATTGLMLFKNALHAHIFLDFPPQIMFGILQRALVWMLAGALAGLSLGLAVSAMRDERGA